MGLPFLKSGVVIKTRISVIHSHHETHGQSIVGKPVDPTSPEFISGERPPCRVHHFALHGVLHFPEFLDPHAPNLRVGILVQVQFRKQGFRQGPSSPFRQDRDFSPDVESRLESPFFFS